MSDMSNPPSVPADKASGKYTPLFDDEAFFSWALPSTNEAQDVSNNFHFDNIDPLINSAETQLDTRNIPSGLLEGSLNPPSTSSTDHNSSTSSDFTTFTGSGSIQSSSTNIVANTPFRSSYINSESKQQAKQQHDRCIFACAELVAYLEARRRDGPFAMDEILSVNKDATNKINKLITADYFSKSDSCLVFLTTAAESVVGLLEEVMRGKPYNKSITPCVGFGNFVIDPEEQVALQARIISRELHICHNVIRRLSASVTERDGGSAQEKIKAWLQNLEQRIEGLIVAVEEG